MQPLSVHPFAQDAAFAKHIGERKVDRGSITIGPERFRHPELAAFSGRKVAAAQLFRRDAFSLVDLPGVGWIALEPEMLNLPGDISGALESSRMQKARTAMRPMQAKRQMPIAEPETRQHPPAMAPAMAPATAPVLPQAGCTKGQNTQGEDDSYAHDEGRFGGEGDDGLCRLLRCLSPVCDPARGSIFL